MKQKTKRPTFDQQLGKRLRLIRVLTGHSQKTVAHAIGISFQQLQKYEQGVNRLSVEKLIEIARFLRVSPVEFIATLSDEDPPTCSHLVPLDSEQLLLLQHYRKIRTPDKRQAVVKIAQWLS